MYILTLLIGVTLAVSARAQACPPTEVVFLLDESENALMAASTDPINRPFDLLMAAIRSFAQHPIITNSKSPFRIGAISYSSGTDQRATIPIGSSPAQAAVSASNIGQVGHAQSTTSRGLQFLTTRPTYSNSLVIVISSQGSGTPAGQAQTRLQADRVYKTLGWNPYVLAVPGKGKMDMVELTLANKGQPPILLADPNAVIPNGYKRLTESLNQVVEEILCIDPIVQPGPIVQPKPVSRPSSLPLPVFPPRPLKPGVTCPPTEVLFLLDESENAHLAASTDPDLRSFDILQQAIGNFVNHPLIRASTNDFRIGAISYSSGTDTNQTIPIGSNAFQANMNIANIGRIVGHGGSWTYRGLQYLNSLNALPTYGSNNLLIVVSSQGSRVASRQQLARQQAQRVTRQLGWRPFVIAVEGSSPLDMVELTDINNGKTPFVVRATESPPLPPQGYRQLTNALYMVIEQMLCTLPIAAPAPVVPVVPVAPVVPVVPVAPVAPAPIVPRAPVPTGICNDCLFEAGYGFDFDPFYCDSYYMCLPGQAPIRKSCPAGTFWSGSTCNFIDKVNCAAATCIASTPAGTTYPSGRCCNKYFDCEAGTLTEESCPIGQVYDAQARFCISLQNTTSMCESRGRLICDVNMGGQGAGGGKGSCEMYSPDAFGNKCRFQFANFTINSPPGTVWSQEKCSLVFDDTAQCGTTETAGSKFFGASRAEVCNAVFLATFDNGKRTVFSERQNRELAVAASIQGARLQQNGLVFDSSMARPYAYYFFFNNRAVRENTAFRIRFSLSQNAPAGRYDILSNNFCDLCTETVSITVSSRGGNQREVTARFVLTNGQAVSTTAILNKQVSSSLLEATVVISANSIGGQVKELRANSYAAVAAATAFNPAPKPTGTEVQPNRCGFMLGQGPNSNFLGIIDDFAVFEYCKNINQVLV